MDRQKDSVHSRNQWDTEATTKQSEWKQNYTCRLPSETGRHSETFILQTGKHKTTTHTRIRSFKTQALKPLELLGVCAAVQLTWGTYREISTNPKTPSLNPCDWRENIWSSDWSQRETHIWSQISTVRFSVTTVWVNVYLNSILHKRVWKCISLHLKQYERQQLLISLVRKWRPQNELVKIIRALHKRLIFMSNQVRRGTRWPTQSSVFK